MSSIPPEIRAIRAQAHAQSRAGLPSTSPQTVPRTNPPPPPALPLAAAPTPFCLTADDRSAFRREGVCVSKQPVSPVLVRAAQQVRYGRRELWELASQLTVAWVPCSLFALGLSSLPQHIKSSHIRRSGMTPHGLTCSPLSTCCTQVGCGQRWRVFS